MAQTPDYLQLITGFSSTELGKGVQQLAKQWNELEVRLLYLLTDKPIPANIGFILSCSTAFYLAEHKLNPRINTFIDACYYISTCLSVGYADIFPVTQRGRAIATLVMTIGPALTAELLDPPHHAVAASESGQNQIIALLEAMLKELKKEA